jgi:hypothetical protein
MRIEAIFSAVNGSSPWMERRIRVWTRRFRSGDPRVRRPQSALPNRVPDQCLGRFHARLPLDASSLRFGRTLTSQIGTSRWLSCWFSHGRCNFGWDDAGISLRVAWASPRRHVTSAVVWTKVTPVRTPAPCVRRRVTCFRGHGHRDHQQTTRYRRWRPVRRSDATPPSHMSTSLRRGQTAAQW